MQQAIKKTAAASTPTITPEKQKYEDQGRYRPPDYSQPSASDTSSDTSSVTSPVNAGQGCDKGGSPSNISEQTGLGEKIWNGVKDVSVWVYNGAKELVTSLFGAEHTISASPPKSPDFSFKLKPILRFTTNSIITHIIEEHGDSSKPFSVYAENNVTDFIASSIGAKVNIGSVALQLNLALNDIQLSLQHSSNGDSYSVGIKIDLSQISVGVEASNSHRDGDTVITQYSNVDVDGIAFVALLLVAVSSNLGLPVYT